jgi:hypothetical protein
LDCVHAITMVAQMNSPRNCHLGGDLERIPEGEASASPMVLAPPRSPSKMGR